MKKRLYIYFFLLQCSKLQADLKSCPHSRIKFKMRWYRDNKQLHLSGDAERGSHAACGVRRKREPFPGGNWSRCKGVFGVVRVRGCGAARDLHLPWVRGERWDGS